MFRAALSPVTPPPHGSRDRAADGAEIQDKLTDLSGQRTVPRTCQHAQARPIAHPLTFAADVFVGGEFLGGYSEVAQMHEDGYLVPRLEAAGAVGGTQ